MWISTAAPWTTGFTYRLLHKIYNSVNIDHARDKKPYSIWSFLTTTGAEILLYVQLVCTCHVYRVKVVVAVKVTTSITWLLADTHIHRGHSNWPCPISTNGPYLKKNTNTLSLVERWFHVTEIKSISTCPQFHNNQWCTVLMLWGSSRGCQGRTQPQEDGPTRLCPSPAVDKCVLCSTRSPLVLCLGRSSCYAGQ